MANEYGSLKTKRFGDVIWAYGYITSAGANTMMIEWECPKGMELQVQTVQGYTNNAATVAASLWVLSDSHRYAGAIVTHADDVNAWRVLTQDLAASTYTPWDLTSQHPIIFGDGQFLRFQGAMTAGSKDLRITASFKVLRDRQVSDYQQ